MSTMESPREGLANRKVSQSSILAFKSHLVPNAFVRSDGPLVHQNLLQTDDSHATLLSASRIGGDSHFELMRTV